MEIQTPVRIYSEQAVSMLAIKAARKELKLVEHKAFMDLMEEAAQQGISSEELERSWVQVQYRLMVRR